jgi:hypothetical protein
MIIYYLVQVQKYTIIIQYDVQRNKSMSSVKVNRRVDSGLILVSKLTENHTENVLLSKRLLTLNNVTVLREKYLNIA